MEGTTGSATPDTADATTPVVAETAPDAAVVAAEPASPARPRATGPPHEGAGIGIAIGIVTAIGFAVLGFLIAFSFFASIAIYALVKAIGDEGSGNPVVVAIITVLLMTTFVALLLVGIGRIGGSLTPKRRDRRSPR